MGIDWAVMGTVRSVMLTVHSDQLWLRRCALFSERRGWRKACGLGPNPCWSTYRSPSSPSRQICRGRLNKEEHLVLIADGNAGGLAEPLVLVEVAVGGGDVKFFAPWLEESGSGVRVFPGEDFAPGFANVLEEGLAGLVSVAQVFLVLLFGIFPLDTCNDTSYSKLVYGLLDVSWAVRIA